MASYTSVQVVSDRYTPLAGIPVRIGDGTTTFTSSTGAEGQLAWFDLDHQAPLELVLGEVVRPEGIALGSLSWVAPFSSATDEAVLLSMVSRSQALAVPFTVEPPSKGGSRYLSDRSGAHPHWSLQVPVQSSLKFSGHAAPLLDAAAVDEYLAYHGFAPAQSDLYFRGAALVLPGIQLGPTGIVVSVDLLGAEGSNSSDMAVDVFNFSAAHQAPAGLPLAATLLGVEHGRGFVQVTGGVLQGHLAVFFRSANDGPTAVYREPDRRPSLVLPPDDGSEVEFAMQRGPDGDSWEAVPIASSATTSHGAALSSLARAEDCEPETPRQTGWECTPLIPPPTDPACASASELGPRTCEVVRTRSPRFCRVPRARLVATKATTAAWKSVFKLTGGTAPLQSQGGFEYGETSQTVETDEWICAPGASNEGQCMRFYRFELVCAAWATLYENSWLFDSEDGLQVLPCFDARSEVVLCRDTSTSQSVCDRLP